MFPFLNPHLQTTKNSLSELEKRERRAMERKLSEMEEELKVNYPIVHLITFKAPYFRYIKSETTFLYENTTHTYDQCTYHNSTITNTDFFMIYFWT